MEQVRYLQNVSFDVNRGRMSGDHWSSSGCGKSTLAHVLTGIIPNSIPAQVTGSVNYRRLGCASSSHVRVIARQVGVVFQNPRAHLFHLRVDDEVAFGPRNLGLSEDEVSARVDWALNAVGLARPSRPKTCQPLRRTNPTHRHCRRACHASQSACARRTHCLA